MNKILKTALCGVALVPTAFCFSACGSNDLSQNEINKNLKKVANNCVAETYTDYSNRVITLTNEMIQKSTSEKTYKENETDTNTVTKNVTDTMVVKSTKNIELMGKGNDSALRLVETEEINSTDYSVESGTQLLKEVTNSTKTIDEYVISKRANGTETEYVVVYRHVEFANGQEVTANAMNQYQVLDEVAFKTAMENMHAEIDDYIMATFVIAPTSSVMGMQNVDVDATKDGDKLTVNMAMNRFTCDFDYGSTILSDVEAKFVYKDNAPVSATSTSKYNTQHLIGEIDSSVSEQKLKIKNKKLTISVPVTTEFDETVIDLDILDLNIM